MKRINFLREVKIGIQISLKVYLKFVTCPQIRRASKIYEYGSQIYTNTFIMYAIWRKELN